MSNVPFMGFVPASETPSFHGVVFDLKENYTPESGPNAGKNMGNVLFFKGAKANEPDRMVFATANEAIAAFVADKPKGVKLYAGGYCTPAQAKDKNIIAVKFKHPDRDLGRLQFIAADYVDRKNKEYAAKQAKKFGAVAAPEPKAPTKSTGSKKKSLF